MTRRDIPGVLGGSRLIELPEVAAEVAAFSAALASRPRALIEVGFDHGRRLSATARAAPQWAVVGLEVRRRRVAEARERATRDGLDNLHAFRLDARMVLARGAPDASADVVEALFPTPWEGGKAAKRMLVTAPWLQDVARVLRPDGLLHLATDVPWYAEQIAALLAACPALGTVPEARLDATRPPCPQRSRREWRCAQDGLRVWRFVASHRSR